MGTTVATVLGSLVLAVAIVPAADEPTSRR